MKRIILFSIIVLLSTIGYAQSTDRQMNQQSISTIVNMDARYVLFRTANFHIYIKLDTRTGKMWLVQFSTESLSDMMEVPLSTESLLQTGATAENGRFYLYPTQNMYTFILVDQISGPTYQVQWSTTASNNAVYPIGSNH